MSIHLAMAEDAHPEEQADYEGLRQRRPTAQEATIRQADSEGLRPLPTGHDDGEESFCRICHQTADESKEQLVKPCRCSGSMGHVHSSCLVERLKRGNSHDTQDLYCDICRSELVVRRMKRMAIFSGNHDISGLIFTALLVCNIVYQRCFFNSRRGVDEGNSLTLNKSTGYYARHLSFWSKLSQASVSSLW